MLSSVIAAAIFLAFATGVRRGELLGLRWRDVDLERARLSVVQAVEQVRGVVKKGVALKEPKTSHGRRTIALSPAAVAELRRHRAEQAKERLKLGLGKVEGNLVFTTALGEVIAPNAFSKAFAAIVARVGIPRCRVHALRHTHITELLRAGVHPKIASERAGHSSVAMTLDTYSHAVPSMQEDAALRIEGTLRALLD
jgi:integrase